MKQLSEAQCERLTELGQELIGLPPGSSAVSAFKRSLATMAREAGCEEPLVCIAHKRLISMVNVRPLSQTAPFRQIARAWADAGMR